MFHSKLKFASALLLCTISVTCHGQDSGISRNPSYESGLSCNFGDFTTCSWTFVGKATSIFHPSHTDTKSDYAWLIASNNDETASDRITQLPDGTDAISLLTSPWINLTKPTQLFLRYFPYSVDSYARTQLRIWALVGEAHRVVDLFPDYERTAKYKPLENGPWIAARLAVCLTGERVQLVIGGQSDRPSLIGLGLDSVKLLDEDAIATFRNKLPPQKALNHLDNCSSTYPNYDNSITCTWIEYSTADRPAKFCGWNVSENIGTEGYELIDNCCCGSAGKFLRIRSDRKSFTTFARLKSPEVAVKFTGSTTFHFRFASRFCRSCKLFVNIASEDAGVFRQTQVLPDTNGYTVLYSVDVSVAAGDNISFEFEIDIYYDGPYGNPGLVWSWTDPRFDLDRTYYSAEPGFEWNVLHDDTVGETLTTKIPTNPNVATKRSDTTTHSLDTAHALVNQQTPLELGLGLGLGVTFLILTAAGILHLLRRQHRHRLPGTMRRNLIAKNPGFYERESADSESFTSVIQSANSLEKTSFDISPETLEISDTVLGRGEFGIVFKGLARKLPMVTKGPTVVAVKLLVQNAGKDQLASFAAEYRVMLKAGHHINVVRLLGIVQQEQPYIVLEFCRFGSLQTYLRNRRHGAVYVHVDDHGRLLDCDEDKMKRQWSDLCRRDDRPVDAENMAEHMLSTNDLISFSHQICRGMEYLVSRSIIHRDLAARNILVSDNRVVKISDFGLARHGCESYSLSSPFTTLPILLMPPETITERQFSEKSDIWSFGILLWEIFSLGGSPFDRPDVVKFTSLAFADWLMKGHQMNRPEGAPLEVYKIMQKCWTLQADRRPKFSTIWPMLDHLISTSSASNYYLPLQFGNILNSANTEESKAESHFSTRIPSVARTPEIIN